MTSTVKLAALNQKADAAPKNWISHPPSMGPTAREMFHWVEFKKTALRITPPGTSSTTMACCTGAPTDAVAPPPKEKATSTQNVSASICTTQARATATTICPTTVTKNRRVRL